MAIDLPSKITDSKVLAEAIYDYWISLLKIDKAVDSSAAEWSELDDTTRIDFTESVAVHVSDVVLPILEKAERAAMERVAGLPTNGEVACYVCSSRRVIFPGNICVECTAAHIKGSTL